MRHYICLLNKLAVCLVNSLTRGLIIVTSFPEQIMFVCLVILYEGARHLKSRPRRGFCYKYLSIPLSWVDHLTLKTRIVFVSVKLP